jgi:hypothetical protein
VFSRTDTVTDSETFYSSTLDLFDNADEQGEVKDLVAWWNWYVDHQASANVRLIGSFVSQVFPNYSTAKRPIATGSALARIRARQAALKDATNASALHHA